MQQLSSEALVGATLGEYRLEHLLGKGELSSVYLATSPRATTPFTLRLLHVNADQSTEVGAAYLPRFQQQASHIATLQHPYILPLVDFNVWRGTPYLVWPGISARALTSRLAQNVQLDVLTVGRYLDQIAAALEYAHEHATLHRNLTTDSIYIQRDGQLLVGDFGVRRLIELGRQDAQWYALYDLGEACAPEQLLGQRANTYTDVYGLGCVLYRLLTGHPVFTGDTREDIAHLHLHAPVPPLGSWRGALPNGLDMVIGAALAKEPEQRESHPGAIANGYHQIVTPNNPARVPFAISTLPASPQQSLPTPGVANWSNGNDNGAASVAYSTLGPTQRPPLPDPSPRSLTPFAPATSNVHQQAAGSTSRVQPAPRRGNVGVLVLASVLIVAMIAGGAFVLLRGNNAGLMGGSATVVFSDSSSGEPGHTDALTISATHLPSPSAGYSYQAWLIDTQKEHIIPLGTLVQKGNGFTLAYAGDGSGGHGGTNLLGVGDKLEVSLERGAVTAPIGTIVLSISFPHVAFTHVQHLLFAFPATPGHIGLAVGLLTQTRLLNQQGKFLQQAATNGDTVAAQCFAQSMTDIIQGAHGQQYKPLSDACVAKGITATGDGFGLLKAANSPNTDEATGYLEGVSDHASLAGSGPDATAAVRSHGAEVITALSNLKGWLTTIQQETLDLLKDPQNAAEAQAVAALCDRAYKGVDANGDGRIDPIAGESGVQSAYISAQLMASLSLAAPK